MNLTPIKKELENILQNRFLIVLFFLAFFLRVVKLNWDQPFILHPDEDQGVLTPIMELVGKGKIQTLWYGPLNFLISALFAFAIYLFRFIFLKSAVLDEKSIILGGRISSVLFATSSLYLVWKILKVLFTKSPKLNLVIFYLLALNIGLIQNAHFATPESLLTFFYLLFTYVSLKFLLTKKLKLYWYLVIIFTGAVLTKLNGLFLCLPLLLLLLKNKQLFFKKDLLKKKSNLKLAAFSLLVSIFFLFLINWLSFFDQAGKLIRGIFWGKRVMIFSLQFVDQPFLIFSLKNIMPYIIAPVSSLLLVLSTLHNFTYLFLKKQRDKKEIFIFWLSFFTLFYFLIINLQFVRFTRYFVPLIPFLFINFAFWLNQFFLNQKNILRRTFFPFIILLFLTGEISFFSVKFLKIYFQADTRIQARNWVCTNLKGKSVLLEKYDYNTKVFHCLSNFTYFDVFNLGNNNIDEFLQNINTYDYIIIASEKNYRNIMRLPNQFPDKNKYYNQLFQEKMGFKLVKTFKLDFPDDEAEETFRVLDHPKILIFKNENLQEK